MMQYPIPKNDTKNITRIEIIIAIAELYPYPISCIAPTSL